MAYTLAQYAAFQLTAARRRLDGKSRSLPLNSDVSTHSRPKAAGDDFNR